MSEKVRVIGHAITDPALIGSDYIDPRSLESIPDSVDAFCDTLIHQVTEPRPLGIGALINEAMSAKGSWSQCCSGNIGSIVDDHPFGRLYVDGTEEKALLDGKTQGVRLARTSGAETSAHQVFFARLTGYTGDIRVAVKPHASGTERAITEWANTLIARKLGFGAFSIVGFIRTESGGYLLSPRRDDVESLDNMEWTSGLTGSREGYDMLSYLPRLGSLMARLQSKGGYHCDPQLKNFVIDQEDSLDYIDWEAAKFLGAIDWASISYEEEETHLNAATRDLKILFGSLARGVDRHGVGLLDGLTYPAQLAYFKEYILNPYLEERLTILDERSEANVDRAILHLTQIELKMEEYILSGELYKTLSRNRDHHE